MTPTIDHLFRRPALLPAVARLIYDEFWIGRPGYSPAYFEGRLRNASDPARIPLSLVAVEDGDAVGTINLIDNDDDARPQLWPWLAALAVVAPRRRQGIGAQLVRALLAECVRLRIDTVYFGTDGPGFYRRLGAVTHEQIRADFQIMRFEGLLDRATQGGG